MTSELELWAQRVTATPEMLRMAQRINVESTLDTSQMDSAVLNIAQNILTAEDEDAIFAAANIGTIATKDYLNKPFLLMGEDIQWRKSGLVFEEGQGFPWYALLEVTDLTTGERPVLNGGGYTFVHVLYRLQEIDAFDKYKDTGGMPLVLTGKSTSNGQTVVLPNKYKMPVTNASAKKKA